MFRLRELGWPAVRKTIPVAGVIFVLLGLFASIQLLNHTRRSSAQATKAHATARSRPPDATLAHARPVVIAAVPTTTSSFPARGATAPPRLPLATATPLVPVTTLPPVTITSRNAPSTTVLATPLRYATPTTAPWRVALTTTAPWRAAPPTTAPWRAAPTTAPWRPAPPTTWTSPPTTTWAPPTTTPWVPPTTSAPPAWPDVTVTGSSYLGCSGGDPTIEVSAKSDYNVTFDPAYGQVGNSGISGPGTYSISIDFAQWSNPITSCWMLVNGIVYHATIPAVVIPASC